ncbi:MAG: NUDIX domain-containing protein [Actinomycetota bacterium]|nr:NUDIX domain-containing protein [Actinomycetota bacterium]
MTEQAKAEELLDVVEPTGARVGPLPRSQVHAEGLWHQVFHCLLVRTDAPARVLLQRRRRTAAAFAGKLDVSASGHLQAGEQPLDGVRELQEETGLVVVPERLVPLGRRLLADDGGEGRNREVVHVYLAGDDTPLTALRLDPAEVDGFVELAVADLLRLLADADAVVPAMEVDCVGVVRPVACAQADLVPAVDGYWVVLATMAQRFADGVRPLAI